MAQHAEVGPGSGFLLLLLMITMMLLLFRQVHDEVILEGPEESAEAALAETVRCMQQPWDGIGLKELRVRGEKHENLVIFLPLRLLLLQNSSCSNWTRDSRREHFGAVVSLWTSYCCTPLFRFVCFYSCSICSCVFTPWFYLLHCCMRVVFLPGGPLGRRQVRQDLVRRQVKTQRRRCSGQADREQLLPQEEGPPLCPS